MAYDPDPQLGATPFYLLSAGVTEDKTVAKATPGRLMSFSASNINAAFCYVKFYDKATVPAVASDTPVLSYCIPGSTAGGTFNAVLPKEGINFAAGISFVIVLTAAITGAGEVAANEVIVNGSYK